MMPYYFSLLIKDAALKKLKVVLDTMGQGGELKAVDSFFSYMVGKNPIDGYFYISMQSTGGPPNNRASFIYKIDPITLLVEDSYKIPTTNTDTFDSHPKATLTFDNEGHLLIAREKGSATSTGTSDGHNTDVLFYKTSIVGDLSSIYLHKTISGKFSYPYISFINGIIYITPRGDSSGNVELDILTVLKSSDGGDNFFEHKIIDTGSGSEGRAYSSSVCTFDDNYLYKILNIRKDSLASFESVIFLKTLDGVNWSNVDGSFSKDTGSDGALNISELKANFMVWEKPSDDYAINYEGGVVKNGIPRLLISKSLRDPGNIVDGNAYQTYKELRFYTHNGEDWEYKDLSFMLPIDYYVLWSREKVVQLAWDKLNDYVHIVDRTAINIPLYEYKSKDLFVNWIEEP